MTRTHLVPLVALLALGAGCRATLESDLDEAQADEVILALYESGIGANKTAEAGASRAPRYRVEVDRDEVGHALAILRHADLPRHAPAGMGEVFAEASLVPTATEERARYVAAVTGELTRTLESIDSVVDARVHLALPEPSVRLLDQAPSEPRASVLLKYRAGAHPPDEAAVRALVSGAVVDIPAERVAVVRMEVPSAPPAERSLVTVGPVTVTRASAARLRVILAVGLVVLMGLALVLLWIVKRDRGRRMLRPTAR